MTSNTNSFLTVEDVRYICSKISSISEIPIYFFNADGEVIFEYSYEYSTNPLYNSKQDLFAEVLNINKGKSLLNLISTKYYENYFSIKVNSNEKFIGTIIVGPTITIAIDEKSIESIIKEFNIKIKHKDELIKYYNCITILDYNKFMDIGRLLYFSIYQQKVNLSDIQKDTQTIFNLNLKTENSFEIYDSIKRRDNISHHSQSYERELLECIKEGDLGKLNVFFNSNSITGEKGIHSKNPLRNEKNILISFISLVSHVSIEGGLDWELALRLSDFYILSVEECNSIKEIDNLSAKILVDYTERVHKIKTGKYSSSILKCKNFIFEHLYEKISLTQLASHIGMNSSYLSHLFKKEVGLSISDYIQKERIQEAQKLIRAGEKSLSDIYVPLGFIDQSHFTKSFKKVTGITPKEYRLLFKQ